MYRKSSVFASGSTAIAVKTEADFRQGMVPNTVAMAEDVNAYGQSSDKMNWTMSQEISNLLEAYGITLGSDYVSDPTNAANKMLLKLFNEKLSNSRCLTGVTAVSGTIPTITQSGSNLSVPAMSIRFNSTVYYSDTADQTESVDISAQTYSVGAGTANGVYYLYATSAGALAAQTTPVLGSDGATKCFLGSYYVYNNAIQAGSWKYQPWLQVTSVEDRESPTAFTKGGYISAISASRLQMGALEVQAEGINVDSNSYAPNIKTFQGVNPFTYKPLYPGYNPGASGLSDFGTSNSNDAATHIYNMTNDSWVDITTWAEGFGTPKYMVIVPCITPAGQTLVIPAMSNYSSSNFTSVFDSQTDAANAVFGLQYEGLDEVASRVIYFGVSLVIRIPTTSQPLDLTNPADLMVVGRLPQALEGFTSAAGQSGGGAGSYIPMKSYTYDSTYQTVNCVNNAVSIIEGHPTTAVSVNMPSPTSGIMNQVVIHYAHTSSKQGLAFSNVKWWYSRTPVYTDGYTYEIIGEYVNGYWRLGFIEGAN